MHTNNHTLIRTYTKTNKKKQRTTHTHTHTTTHTHKQIQRRIHNHTRTRTHTHTNMAICYVQLLFPFEQKTLGGCFPVDVMAFLLHTDSFNKYFISLAWHSSRANVIGTIRCVRGGSAFTLKHTKLIPTRHSNPANMHVISTSPKQCTLITQKNMWTRHKYSRPILHFFLLLFSISKSM